MPKIDPKISLINFDPISTFIKGKLKLTPLTFAISIFFADLLVDGFLGFYFDAFYPKASNPGLLQDLTALTTDFVANPVIAFVYLWILSGSANLFQNLLMNKVFTDEGIFWREIERVKKLYSSRIIFYITAILATIFTLNQVAAYNHWVNWSTLSGYIYINPKMSFFRIPFWFITMYGLIFSLLNAGITFIALQKIFQKPQSLKLYLSHPDRCAGYGSIGTFITNTGFIVAPISFWVSVTVISEKNHLLDVYPVVLVLLVYIILAPIIFLWPLLSAHQAMVIAKRKILLELSEKINNANNDLLIGNGDIKKSWETIDIYQNLYDKSLKIPEWPFNFGNLQRFFTIIGSSLLPVLGSYILDFIVTRLNPYIKSLIP